MNTDTFLDKFSRQLAEISTIINDITLSEETSQLQIDVLKLKLCVFYADILSLEKRLYAQPFEKEEVTVNNELLAEPQKEEFENNNLEPESSIIENVAISAQQELQLEYAKNVEDDKQAEENEAETPVVEPEPESLSEVEIAQEPMLVQPMMLNQSEAEVPILHFEALNDVAVETAETKKQPEEPLVDKNTVSEDSEKNVHSFLHQIKVVSDIPVAAAVESSSETDTNTPKKNSPLDIFSSLQTIADHYKDSSTVFLNEKIGHQEQNGANNLNKQHSDLKAAIGINEKFLFINELFKGNMKEYTDTIIGLNEKADLESAFQYLEPMKNKYNWQDDSVAYLTLKDFIKVRFL